jgi:D-xylose transport system substrate-binding protein
MRVRATLAAAIATTAIVASACSAAATPAPTTAPTAAPTAAPSAAPSAAASASASAAPSAAASAAAGLSASSFDSSFSAMSQLASVFAAGSGMVGVILPDTQTSTRYTQYDAPYLTQAFTAAGYKSTDFKIDNASGTATTQLALAQADIAAGAKVLLVDPLDSNTGKAVQAAAAAAGIPMISYDRATFQGATTYYVSFDNVQVGELIGKGFNQCVTDWGVSKPMVFTLDGGQDTDPNAIDFAKGYNDAVWGQKVAQVKAGTTNSAGMTLVGEQLAPGWDNAKGGNIFQQAFTANKSINATIEANDGLAGAVIAKLKAAGVKAKSIPTTGQDASLQGMAYVLQDWQCGSVYKPIYLEAQAAVALATYLRAGQTPPAALVNGTTTDPSNSSTTEPAVLLTPVWVTKANMESTVIKDQAIKASDLCALAGTDVCTANGIQ